MAFPPRVHGADEQDDVPVDVLRYIGLAELVLSAERVTPYAEMSVMFVDEATIAQLNERFLDGTGPTDVLAFPLDEELLGGRNPDQGGRGPGAGIEPTDPPVLIGDVVVCPRVAQRQAVEHHGSLDDELALLVVHGTLHLLRYDHAEPAEAARMQARERELLASFAARTGSPREQP
jgi:probable rRNA maturation factor